jgi:hypothetical protein
MTLDEEAWALQLSLRTANRQWAFAWAGLAADFADRSVPALRDAVTSGWNLPDELKKPDFDAIRDRADFKTLVMELEKETEPKK